MEIYTDICKTPINREISKSLGANNIKVLHDDINKIMCHVLESVVILGHKFSNKGRSVFILDDEGNPVMKYVGRVDGKLTMVFNDDKPKTTDIIISRAGVMKGKKDLDKEFDEIVNNVAWFDGIKYNQATILEVFVTTVIELRKYLLSRKKGGIRLFGAFTTDSDSTDAILCISHHLENVCRCSSIQYGVYDIELPKLKK